VASVATHHRDVDLAPAQSFRRIVGADQIDRDPGGPLEARNRVLGPWVGQ